jgi:hypothetical protein
MNARLLAAALTSAGFLAVLGCSDDGLGKRFPVTGTVTYKGAPLPKGSITFLPVDPTGRGATGEVKDGSYSMMTQTPGDGMFPGTYDVTITDLTVDFSNAQAETDKMAKKNKVEVGAMPDQAAVAKAYKSASNSLPAKYSQISTSGLKFEVKPESNKFNIELKD